MDIQKQSSPFVKQKSKLDLSLIFSNPELLASFREFLKTSCSEENLSFILDVGLSIFSLFSFYSYLKSQTTEY
jgi:hypothetical protein